MMDDGRLYDLEKKVHELQAQIAAMTKDMESMKPWRELQRENEELRQKWLSPETYQTLMDERQELLHELATLKAQSTEQPVAWMYHYPDVFGKGEYISFERKAGIAPVAATPLYTAPPTATALVEDFKRRAVEVCDKIGNHDNGYACSAAIWNLPLIEGEKHE